MNRRDALFDFDDQIDQLSEVSDRYPIDMFSKVLQEQNNQQTVDQERGGQGGTDCEELKSELIKEMTQHKRQSSQTNLR